MAAIFYLSSQSSPPGPGGVPDYVLHGVEYAGLAVVTFRALAGGLPARVTGTRALLALLITVAYGVSDELHQRFVPLRTADVRDVGADVAGALIGLFLCWAWNIIAGPRSGTPTAAAQR